MTRARLTPPPSTRQIESPYLTSREACVYLRLNSLSSLYRHIRENRLPVLRAGGDLRFDMRELDAWLRGTTSIEVEGAIRRGGGEGGGG